MLAAGEHRLDGADVPPLGFIDGTTLPVFGGRYHPMLATRQLTALLDAAMGADHRACQSGTFARSQRKSSLAGVKAV
jgi:hypothetical protein